MGFDSVYRSLIELFPQIDQRLLRAVAIEHSKDADAAVESVILEIIPYWSQRRFAAFSPPKDVRPVGTSDGLDTGFAVESEAEHEEQSKLLRRRTVGAESDVSTSSGVPLMTEQAYENDVTLSAHLTGSTNDEALITSAIEAEREEQSKLLSQMVDGEKEVGSSSGVTSVTRQVYDYESDGSTGAHLTGSTNDETLVASTTILNFYDSCYGKSITSTGEELILLEGARENSHQFGLVDEANNLTNEGGDNVTVSPELPSNLVQDKAGVSDNLIDLHHEWKDFEGPCADDFEMISCSKLDQTKSCLDGSPVEGKCSLVEVVPSSPQENTIDTICGSPHVDIDTSASTDDFEKLEAGGSIDLNRNDEFPIVQKEDMDDDANIIITRSGQICRVDLLEEIIEVSKNHKKTLFAAMESVMNMVREVELQEKAAETAELEAARGGLDILVEVEKLKTMLGHAKETNDMHAGEVYGEKAILATELRELQNRLLSLSDERDKSLAILDEMHQSLEARLAVAEKLKKAAEQEKLEKEESARNALAEQEAIMDMVVQDSKILQQEAEENSKLQEFLVDRGHIVDALQGEISVICQDVRLLKENFDGRVPLSKSVSSSQTSCILASSGSSVKSMALDLLSEKNGTSKSSLKGSQTPTDAQSSGSRHEVETNSMDAQSPGSRDEEEITSPGRIALLDDGWDIFEKDAELQQGK